MFDEYFCITARRDSLTRFLGPFLFNWKDMKIVIGPDQVYFSLQWRFQF
jgi:hypothetical protein